MRNGYTTILSEVLVEAAQNYVHASITKELSWAAGSSDIVHRPSYTFFPRRLGSGIPSRQRAAPFMWTWPWLLLLLLRVVAHTKNKTAIQTVNTCHSWSRK